MPMVHSVRLGFATKRDLQYELPERMNEVQDVSLSQLMIFDISEKKAAVPGGPR